MSDRNLVITVRLSDVDEMDQPDPICLPADELATWRHFEALLQSMYRDPPPAIKVCYLDDESDWIEVSSDTELREAIRVAQSTDEILQLQVKRKDAVKDAYFECTLPDTTVTPSDEPEAPHVTPLHTTYYDNRNRDETFLVYPHPTTSSSSNTHNTNINSSIPSMPWSCMYPQVHPNPDERTSVSAATGNSEIDRKPNENVMLMEANGRSAYIQNRPDLSTDEKVQRLKARLSCHKESRDELLKGLNTCLSFKEMFQKASGYSSEDKVKFMKNMATGEKSDEKPENGDQEKQGSATSEILLGEVCKVKPEPLIESLLSDNTISPQQVLFPPNPTVLIQDPFEVVCHDKLSRDLEQIQLNFQSENILKPEKPRDSSLPPEESIMAVDQGSITATAVSVNARPSAAYVPVIPPLCALQMMDGAQSGANAVAIEIPEGDHHGAAQKEEDATASGGAACTSASAETGEVIGNRVCQDGAAVGDKVKVRPASRQSSGSDQANFQLTGGISGIKQASKKSKKTVNSSPSKAALRESEKMKSKKEACPKEAKKVEKKSVKEKEKGACGGLKIEADVESGEKIVKKKKSKGSMLHTKDFVKLMSKMQAELHSGIVKDVGKQTDKLLKKTFSRSVSHDSTLSVTHNSDEFFEEVVHRGIYCDGCNLTIRGIRFKCGNCADFDFCEKCEASQNNHDPAHVFLKLHRPAPQAGRVDAENVPLLREIIYKQSSDSISKENKQAKVQCLEDVPILSISEVTTPGQKQSPPSTPSESHKRTDVSNWVWDSTFDTDKHLYPVEGEGAVGIDNSTLRDSEMKRLYELLTIEAEAANRVNNNGDNLIVEMPKLTSVPELAESVHSLSTLPTSISTVDVDADSSPLLPPAVDTSSCVEMVDEKSFETSVDGLHLQEGCEDPNTDLNQDEDLDSQASLPELVDAEEESDEEEEEGEAFEELEAHNDDGGDNEVCKEEKVVGLQQHDLHSDSDTSDDFCILDPPSNSDLEEIEQESVTGDEQERKVLLHTTDVPSMEIVDHVRAEGEAVGLVTIDVVVNQIESKEEVVEEQIPVAEEKIEAIKVSKPEAMAVFVTEDQIVENDNAGDNDDGKLEEACGGSIEVKDEERRSEDDLAEIDYTQEDILMKMNAEERSCFLEMVKNLKERAQDLENELKLRKEAEAEERVQKEMDLKYQIILEEKQKEAVRENEKLEELQKKKEQEERLKRQQRLLEKEKERKLRQKKNNKDLKLSSGVSVGEGAKKKTRASSLGTKPTLMQMALNSSAKVGKVCGKAVKQEVGVAPPPPSSSLPSSLSQQQSSVAAVQVDNVIYIQSEKKDADCQTTARGVSGAEAAAQASQMIQNMASGVSKAAGAAFHTAKDVFYSLQAKQVEKKTYEGVVYSKTTPINSKASSTDATSTKEPSDEHQETQEQDSATWTPPSSIWTPPSDTFVPPKSDWKPPKVNWIPPKSEWTGPKSEWTPPDGFYQSPSLESESTTAAIADGENKVCNQQQVAKNGDDSDENSKKEKSSAPCSVIEDQCNSVTSTTTMSSSSSLSSSAPTAPLPPLPPIQITDPILRREVQGMQLLIEMGFANREQNRRLLQQYDGDVEKAVQCLLQEEREEHWAWGQRH